MVTDIPGVLDLSETDIESLPDVYNSDTEVVKAFGNRIEYLHDSLFTACSLLRELHLDHNMLKVIPAGIGLLLELRVLSLHDNALVTLPDEIGRLINMEECRLDRNKLVALPDSLCRCEALTLLHIDGNPLTVLPASMGSLANLRDLGIGSCPNLTALPKSLGNLSELAIWVLSPSIIADIPESVLYDPSAGVVSAYIRGREPLLLDYSPTHIDPTPSFADTTVYKLEELGPIILNTDGSMSRIPNWLVLSPTERLNAARLISKRNERRRLELLANKDTEGL